MENVPYIKLKISLKSSHSAVFDLSGTNSFHVFSNVGRFRGDGGDSQCIMLLLYASLLDVPYAYANGLLELIDLDAGSKTVFKPEDDGIARPTPSIWLSDSFEIAEPEEHSRFAFPSDDEKLDTSVQSVEF